ncbi:MAG: choice-of-anchor Q domain-containing protein [Verrucomicrobiota bacterium]
MIFNAATNYGGGVDSCVLAGCNVNSNSVLRFGGGGASYSKLSDCQLSGNISIEGSGGGAHSCAMTNCSLDWNQALQSGGGMYAGTLTNCVLKGNSADYGGGAGSAQLFGCTLTGNSAFGIGGGGGGAYDCILFSCVLLTNSTSSLGGGGGKYCTFNTCLLIGNVATHTLGGGALWSTLNESTLIGNLAHSGGGAYDSDLSNCSVVGNSAVNGGGAMYCDLYGCTVVGNSAGLGGGLVKGTAQNTIVYFNTATSGTNYAGNLSAPVLNYCCTSPLPFGVANITNAPQFADLASYDLRLQSNSPCINAGNISIAPSVFDQLGNPRVSGGAQDMGAYEFQGPASILSYAWAMQNGLPIDGSADFSDPDADGMNNYGEWRADTGPTNALSVLRMVGLTNSAIGVAVTWQSVSTRVYGLERATNLASPTYFEPVESIQGLPGTTTYSDVTATNAGPYFYRVMVQ